MIKNLNVNDNTNLKSNIDISYENYCDIKLKAIMPFLIEKVIYYNINNDCFVTYNQHNQDLDKFFYKIGLNQNKNKLVGNDTNDIIYQWIVKLLVNDNFEESISYKGNLYILKLNNNSLLKKFFLDKDPININYYEISNEIKINIEKLLNMLAEQFIINSFSFVKKLLCKTFIKKYILNYRVILNSTRTLSEDYNNIVKTRSVSLYERIKNNDKISKLVIDSQDNIFIDDRIKKDESKVINENDISQADKDKVSKFYKMNDQTCIKFILKIENNDLKYKLTSEIFESMNVNLIKESNINSLVYTGIDKKIWASINGDPDRKLGLISKEPIDSKENIVEFIGFSKTGRYPIFQAYVQVGSTFDQKKNTFKPNEKLVTQITSIYVQGATKPIVLENENISMEIIK